MKSKDLFRIAKISLAARKKTAKSTVRGIAFGLILLIPVMFIAIGVFGDLNGKVNKNPELLYASFSAAAARTGLPDKTLTPSTFYYGSNDFYQISYNTAKNAFNKIKTPEKIIYEQVTARFNYNLMTTNAAGNSHSFDFAFNNPDGTPGAATGLYVDENRYILAQYNRDDLYAADPGAPFAAIMDLKESGRQGFIPAKYAKKFGSVFVRGFDGGFTGGGKGQVILSEKFIEALGKQNSDFYGKSFRMAYSDAGGVFVNPDTAANGQYYEYEQRPAQYPVPDRLFFDNYKVVGIIKADVTEWAVKTSANNYGVPQHYMANMMLFTSASLMIDEKTALDPKLTLIESDEDEFGRTDSYCVATYDQNAAEIDELNKEYLCLGANVFHSKGSTDSRYYYDGERPEMFSKVKVFADPLTYAELKSAASVLKAELAGVLGDYTFVVSNFFVSDIYGSMDTMYTVFTYLILFLSVIGGIVFFAAMVNLFNSIVHSVDSRKGYLGVLRAVGGKRRLINMMYFAESLTIFRRAVIWIVAFTAAICIGIKLLIDWAFSYINEMMPFTLSIGWLYVPLAIGICLAALLLLGFLFSFGCSWKVSRAKITEILAGN